MQLRHSSSLNRIGIVLLAGLALVALSGCYGYHGGGYGHGYYKHSYHASKHHGSSGRYLHHRHGGRHGLAPRYRPRHR